MISLDKCIQKYQKMCVPKKKKKDINVKVFNMITNIVFHTTANANSIVQLEIQIKKLNNETCQYKCKNCRTCKKRL